MKKITALGRPCLLCAGNEKKKKKNPTKPLSLIVGRDVFTRRLIGGGVPLLLLLPVEATPASAEGTGGQAWALPSATETPRGQG